VQKKHRCTNTKTDEHHESKMPPALPNGDGDKKYNQL